MVRSLTRTICNHEKGSVQYFISHPHIFAATVFGQNLRLEPLTPEKKSMWKREMNCLLSVCDYILEFIPTSQNLQDGTIVEVKFQCFMANFSVGSCPFGMFLILT